MSWCLPSPGALLLRSQGSLHWELLVPKGHQGLEEVLHRNSSHNAAEGKTFNFHIISIIIFLLVHNCSILNFHFLYMSGLAEISSPAAGSQMPLL